MSVTPTWTNPTASPPDLVTGQQLSQTAWEQVLSNLMYLGGSNGSGGSVGSVPVGAILAYGAGTTDPAGWFLCDGRAVSRTTYSALFSVLSTTYGAGDGSSTFNIPDLRSRTLIGPDNFGTAAGAASRTGAGNTVVTLGSTASGEDVHTLTSGEAGVGNHSHSHAHGVTDPTHDHTVPISNNSSTGAQGSTGNGSPVNTSPNSTGISIQSDATATSAAAGSSHNNRPLFQGACYIIKT